MLEENGINYSELIGLLDLKNCALRCLTLNEKKGWKFHKIGIQYDFSDNLDIKLDRSDSGDTFHKSAVWESERSCSATGTSGIGRQRRDRSSWVSASESVFFQFLTDTVKTVVTLSWPGYWSWSFLADGEGARGRPLNTRCKIYYEMSPLHCGSSLAFTGRTMGLRRANPCHGYPGQVVP